jgi:hypothetical protein
VAAAVAAATSFVEDTAQAATFAVLKQQHPLRMIAYQPAALAAVMAAAVALQDALTV